MRGFSRSVRKCMKTWVFFVLISATLYLIISSPNYSNKPCIPLKANEAVIAGLCRSVMDGDPEAIKFATEYAWCKRDDALSADHYMNTLSSVSACSSFLSKNGYLSYNITTEELEFPLAFSILMHENVEQVERLLRLIYRPQNVYCIHVDSKSPTSVHRAVEAIVSCFDNVFVASQSIDIHWGEFSLLEAELGCLRQLLDWPKHWYYYINLMGREFPLRTNRELVQIFTAYSGANDVDGTLHKRPIVWTLFVWRNENWRTTQLKSSPPHKFLIAKGSTHAALSRRFVEFALNDQRAIDLLNWMRDIRAPDEHFFPTLNHNPHLNIPGAYKGDPDLKWFFARMKIWQSETEVCHGQWVRYVCNLGVGDIYRVKSAPQLFVNKIRLEQDPTAFRCLEMWYRNRSLAHVNEDFNLTFYANLPFAVNHV